MAGAGRPKKRDDWQGQDPVLAWDLYNVNPDFSITPKSTWDSIWGPQVEQYIQEQQNKAIQQRPDLMKSPQGRKKLQDFFNQESGDAQYLEELKRREELRQQRIHDAMREGRVAQVMGGRSPAANDDFTDDNLNDLNIPDDRVLLDKLIKNKALKAPREYPEYVYEAIKRKYPKSKTARDFMNEWSKFDKIDSQNIYLRPNHPMLPFSNIIDKLLGGPGAEALNFPTSFNGLIPNLSLGSKFNNSSSTIVIPGVADTTVFNDDNYQDLTTLRHEYEHAKDYKDTGSFRARNIRNSRRGEDNHHLRYKEFFENKYPLQLRLQERRKEGIKDDPEYLKKMFIDEVSQSKNYSNRTPASLKDMMTGAAKSRAKNSPWFGVIKNEPQYAPSSKITNEFYDHNDPNDITSQDDLDTMRDPDDPTYWKPSLQDIMEYEDRSGWTPEDWENYRKQRKVMEMFRFGQ